MNQQKEFDIQIEKRLESVDSYTFEPIKGYPMLHWKGKRPFKSTQYYPAQLKENHNQPVEDWMNEIYWGDNLQVMSHLLKKYRGKVQLVYIDPPFDSKAEYKKKISLKGKQATNDHSAFEEKQYTDIWTNDEYLQYMYERLILIRELLADEGSIIIHLDYHKIHYIRCILDEIFGIENFRNEIIIKRPITKNLQAQFDTINSLSCGHDNILLYSKNSKTRYKQCWDNYESVKADGYWHRFWSGEDRPTMRYELLGVKIEHGQWKWKKERALIAAKNYQDYLISADKKFKETGTKIKLVDYWRKTGKRLEFLRKSGTGTIENWFSPSNKKMANTLWLDCKTYEIKKKYPTQKHEEFISLLIDRFSNPGDIVFDCFMGSGTTQAVAMKLGRKFIGADINLGAIQITTKRLLNIAKELNSRLKTETFFTGFSIFNVNHYDFFRNPVEAKELLKEALEIEPLPISTMYDGEKDGRKVKIMPINRIATQADLNDLKTGFDYKTFEKRNSENPGKAVESLLLICMGHEPDLAATLQKDVPYKLDIEVVDILRDKMNLEFKRESEANVGVEGEYLEIKQFYPLNLLQKMSIMKENISDWRELTESVMIDFNYDGAIFEPAVVDVPENGEWVSGKYKIPPDAGTIKVKITDLLSESLEVELKHG